jgi:SAM-dependent methyltransferase
MSETSPAQFYTGLVADLYEPLLSERAEAEPYVPFLERSGTPALELACGSGLPLVELVARGYEVHGLDSSADMLERCRARAREQGLSVQVYQAEMQSFELPRRYRSVFLAGASFILLIGEPDARSALARIYEHLEPGGSALIPLETPDLSGLERSVGRFREVEALDGGRLRVGLVSFDVDSEGQQLCRRLRYERISPSGEAETLERDWRTQWWSQQQFREMLATAGFGEVSFVAPQGGQSVPDAEVFVALTRKPAGPSD